MKLASHFATIQTHSKTLHSNYHDNYTDIVDKKIPFLKFLYVKPHFLQMSDFLKGYLGYKTIFWNKVAVDV